MEELSSMSTGCKMSKVIQTVTVTATITCSFDEEEDFEELIETEFEYAINRFIGGPMLPDCKLEEYEMNTQSGPMIEIGDEEED